MPPGGAYPLHSTWVAVAAHIVERAIVVAVAANGPLLVTTLIIARPGILSGPMQANIADSYL